MTQTEIDAKELAESDIICFGEEGMSAEEWLKALTENSIVVREVKDGVTAGIAVAKWDAGIGYLYSNAVLPEYRRQGIAARLTQQRVACLSRLGCTKIQAHTRVGNVASQTVLDNAGFRVVQYVPDFYDEFKDGILWER